MTYSQMDLKEIIWRNSQRMPNGCREWKLQRSKGGYGRTSSLPACGRVGNMGAHQLAYIAFRGPIPEGKQLDHVICDNPSCCDPWHVEPSTLVENVMRGNSPHAINARKTHCKFGHSLSDALLNERGHRRCRECNKARCRAYEIHRKR
jgi:hypothetical protein